MTAKFPLMPSVNKWAEHHLGQRGYCSVQTDMNATFIKKINYWGFDFIEFSAYRQKDDYSSAYFIFKRRI